MIALGLALLCAALGYAITAHALLLATLVWHAWRLRPVRAALPCCHLCAGSMVCGKEYVRRGETIVPLCPDCAGIVRGEVAA